MHYTRIWKCCGDCYCQRGAVLMDVSSKVVEIGSYKAACNNERQLNSIVHTADTVQCSIVMTVIVNMQF